jgi:hypothetical protein
MDRSQLTELHYITRMENLASIAKLGVLSNERTARLTHASVALQEVQDRRAAVRIPGGFRLHQYANLYFNARNAMMYLRQGQHMNLGVLSVRVSAIDIPGVVVADRNAAANEVQFGAPDEVLPTLDHGTIFAEWWDHADYWEKRRCKQAMCAEVLVPEVLPPAYVRGVWVSCNEAKEQCDSLGTGLKSKVNAYLFFRGPK